MISQIKHRVAKNFFEAVQNKINKGDFNDIFGRCSLLQSEANRPSWAFLLPSHSYVSNELDLILYSQKELLSNEAVKNVTLTDISRGICLNVELDLKHFIKDVLDTDPTKLHHESSSKKVIVEFSSPNIAKPFHIGHLRSTIIGNTLANIKTKFCHNVIRMNHLGDWGKCKEVAKPKEIGTQFGMIQLGMNLENYSEADLEKNPLEILFKAYVKGNAEAEKHQELYEEAKKIFLDLESEKEEITQLWNKYRGYTLKELQAVYSRLGVDFDEYSWESDCKKKKADGILEMLKQKGILAIDNKGRTVASVKEKQYPLLKSDGSTLYLLRDLVAVKERRKKHLFDEMYYVVENGQSEHFQALKTLCSELKIDEGVKIEHIKFGRVNKMSTRKGKVTFLSEILDEAKERIYIKQRESKNTKISLENKDSADILGVSAIIISDLKQSRLNNYEFSWEQSLNLTGNTGVCMQYCHCRLCNLIAENSCVALSDCDPEALTEPEAINLIMTIARYEETLWNFSLRQEPCVLVSYLLYLVKAINTAYKHLQVKNFEDSHVSSQRLLMFNKSKEVLCEGMKLLGLKPLVKM